MKIEMPVMNAPLPDMVNVKDFGAVGDGEHDDTEAIQKAIDYYEDGCISLGARVYFPEGYYRTTAPLVYNHSEQPEIDWKTGDSKKEIHRNPGG